MRAGWRLVAAPVLAVVGLTALAGASAYWFISGQFDVNTQMALAGGLLALAAFLALAVDQAQTWLGGRQFRYGANAVSLSLIVLAILVLVNYLAQSRYSRRWDLTENQQFTLSDQTKTVLAQLPQPAQVYAFYSSDLGSYRQEAEGLLEEYAYNSNGRLTYEFIDPVLQPTRAQAMGVTSNATVVFALGERREQVSYGGEQEFTSALIRLTSAGPRVVYFTTGHGERSPEEAANVGLSQVRDGLQAENYEVQTLNLLVTDTIPADASAIVVASPTIPLGITETQVISSYLAAGGKAVFLLDPWLQGRAEAGAPDPLVEYLQAQWGIRVADNLVVDPASSQLTDPLVPVAFEYGASPITAKLGGVATAFPAARTVTSAGGQAPPDVLVTSLVRTTDAAWGETDFASLSAGKPANDEQTDEAGPLSLAASAENSRTRARVVVFGDADFASNSGAQWPGNSDMFLNSVNWVTELENLITIRPKADPAYRPPIDASARTLNTIFLLSVVLIPGGVLALGVYVWWSRRKHA